MLSEAFTPLLPVFRAWFTALAGQRLNPLTGLPLLPFARLAFTLGALALFAFTALALSPLLLLTGHPRPMVTPLPRLRSAFTNLAFAALVNTPPLGSAYRSRPIRSGAMATAWRWARPAPVVTISSSQATA